MKTKDAPSPSAAPAHVILLEPWREWGAGKVHRADAELLAALEKEGAKFRAATPREIDLAGNC